MKKNTLKKLLAMILTSATLACAVAPLGATAQAPTVTLPSLTADTNCASYASHGDSKVYYYTGVSKANYDAYISTLKGEGYAEQKTYTSDGSYYALMDNNSNTIFVSFLRSVSGDSLGRLRVFVQKSGTPYHTVSEATSADVCKPMLWQLDVDNSGGADGGMSYVIRLSDGTFVIIDGGYETQNEAKNLYSILKANTVNGAKPVISAWFITHLHIDHWGCLRQFSKDYLDKVTVKGFYYNFPSESIGDVSSTLANNVEAVMKKWSGAKLYSKIHSGMVMGFAGATVEVLATHEDIKQSYYKSSGSSYTLASNGFGGDGNETSTVIRMNIAGQGIMFLADAEQKTSAAMLGTYTSGHLRSYIMQMAHHGFDDTVSADLINAIGPRVVVWPQDIIRYVNGEITAGTRTDTKTFICYFNRDSRSHISALKNQASEIIPAYKNEAFELPYTARTLYKRVPDVENLAVAKTAMIKATQGANSGEPIYIQKSADGKSIRIVGVVNILPSEVNSFDSFGFDVTWTVNGQTHTKSVSTSLVVPSIIANGKTVTASEYGGTYFYSVEIPNVENAELVINGTGTYPVGESKYTITYSVATHSLK